MFASNLSGEQREFKQKPASGFVSEKMSASQMPCFPDWHTTSQNDKFAVTSSSYDRLRFTTGFSEHICVVTRELPVYIV